jgi:hypothetical protein
MSPIFAASVSIVLLKLVSRMHPLPATTILYDMAVEKYQVYTRINAIINTVDRFAQPH